MTPQFTQLEIELVRYLLNHLLDSLAGSLITHEPAIISTADRDVNACQALLAKMEAAAAPAQEHQPQSGDNSVQKLLTAIREYGESDGTVYAIRPPDIEAYLQENPDLAADLEDHDLEEVGQIVMNFMDALGEIGIVELVERELRSAILDQRVTEYPEPDDPMDGDHASALASAGWGMDEDYGCFGCDD